jgi:hypothetical protein
MQRQFALMACLAWVGGGLLGGCGPATATVSGEVTVNGEAVEAGVISFVPDDGAGAPGTTAIEDGRYELQMAPGKKRVQISHTVVTGKRPAYNGPGAPLIEITEERLPPRFNSHTELTFEAQAGRQTKNWNLDLPDDKPRK